MSKTEELLDSAVKDAENAQWPGIVGSLMHPVRDHVVVPGLQVAKGVAHVATPLTDKIPLVDYLSAMGLGIASHLVKKTYLVLPHLPDLQEEARQQAEKDFLNNRKLVFKEPKPAQEHSRSLPFGVNALQAARRSLLQAGGFFVNSVVDLVTAPGDKYNDWKETLDEIKGFLASTGISKEIEGIFDSPRTISNLRILAYAQKVYDSFDNRRSRAMDASLHVPDNLMKKGKHYLKYATAAYGLSMMESVQEPKAAVDGSDKDVKKAVEWLADNQKTRKALETEKKKIADALGIKVEHILYMTSVGGSSDMLRHFVAVDHEHKAVVLAIRGTFTLSDLITDINGMSKHYQYNLAHSGFVHLAEAIWNNPMTQDSVRGALEEFEDYELVLVGHSLGAGVASLLNIKLHVEYSHMKWKIRAFLYASPPSFTLTPDVPSHLQAPVLHALKNSYGFQFGIDTVPFLSVDSVRRLLKLLEEVDNVVKDNDFLRWKMAHGLEPPTADIFEKVRQPVILEGSRSGAERLDVAAQFVVWSRRAGEDFDYAACDPHQLSALNIYVQKGMLKDHFPDRYAKSLDKY